MPRKRSRTTSPRRRDERDDAVTSYEAGYRRVPETRSEMKYAEAALGALFVADVAWYG